MILYYHRIRHLIQDVPALRGLITKGYFGRTKIHPYNIEPSLRLYKASSTGTTHFVTMHFSPLCKNNFKFQRVPYLLK